MSLIDLRQIKGGMELKTAIEKVKGRTIVTDTQTPTDRQTVFAISQYPNLEAIIVRVNGVTYAEGKGYFTVDRVGKTVTWIFTDAANGFDILAEFEVNVVYEVDKLNGEPPIIIKDAPVLTADSTLNYWGHDIELTFTSDPVWEAAITDVKVDGVKATGYSVSSGKVLVPGPHFPSAKTFSVTVTATNYKDAQVSQEITAGVAPTLTADTTDNDVNHEIAITYPTNSDWKDHISGINYGVNALIPTEYDVTQDGVITFPIPTVAKYGHGTFDIEVRSNGYSPVTVQQEVKEGAVVAGWTAEWTQTPSEFGNHVFTDHKITTEDVYGDAYDGANRRIRIYYLGSPTYTLPEPAEVPLKDFDSFPAHPASCGAFWFDDMSGQQIISFENFGIGDTVFRIVYTP